MFHESLRPSLAAVMPGIHGSAIQICEHKLAGESAPYSAGEKVVVKLNLNTQDCHTSIHNTGSSPQVVLAFVRSWSETAAYPKKTSNV